MWFGPEAGVFRELQHPLFSVIDAFWVYPLASFMIVFPGHVRGKEYRVRVHNLPGFRQAFLYLRGRRVGKDRLSQQVIKLAVKYG